MTESGYLEGVGKGAKAGDGGGARHLAGLPVPLKGGLQGITGVPLPEVLALCVSGVSQPQGSRRLCRLPNPPPHVQWTCAMDKSSPGFSHD